MLFSRHMRTMLVLLILFALSPRYSSIAHSQQPITAYDGVAFVVGIENYQNLGSDDQLKKSIDDAEAVRDRLKKLNYDVTFYENLNFSEFYKKWTEFVENVERGQKVVVYLSGHGIEHDGRSYFQAADIPFAKRRNKSQIARFSILIDDLVEDLKSSSPGPVLFVVDACRNDPFARPKKSKPGKIGQELIAVPERVSAPRGGLAEPEVEDGFVIIYSASPGQIALESLDTDVNEKNSVFTRRFIESLNKADQNWVDLARSIQISVENDTLHLDFPQKPSYTSQITGRFCLKTCGQLRQNEFFQGESEKLCNLYTGFTRRLNADLEKTIVKRGNFFIRPYNIDRAAALKYCKGAVSSASNPGRVHYQIGRVFFGSQNYSEAYLSFERAKDLGYISAYAMLGLLVGKPYLGLTDPKQAAEFYQLGYDQGDFLCGSRLGELYLYGKGVPQNLIRAETLLRKANQQKVSHAAITLGIAAERGYFTGKRDLSAARRHYYDAIERNDYEGYVHLAETYLKGLDGDVSQRGDSTAMELLLRAYSRHQSRWAANYIGWYSHNGILREPDVKDAISKYEFALSKGYEQAGINLAQLFTEGKYHEKDKQRAIEALSDVEKINPARAKYMEGWLRYRGFLEGKSKSNDRRAQKLFEDSLEIDRDPRTLNMLGFMISEGRGRVKDPRSGRELLEEADRKFDSFAPMNLGLMEARKNLNLPSISEALPYFERAALRNNSDGLMQIASLYSQGRFGGITNENDAAAMNYARRAVGMRNGWAMNFIGWMTANGRHNGLKPDVLRAAEWYTKAIEQGNSQAAVNLGFLLQEGSISIRNGEFFVPEKNTPDFEMAISYFLKAAQLGHVNVHGYIYELAEYNLNEAEKSDNLLMRKIQSGLSSEISVGNMPWEEYSLILLEHSVRSRQSEYSRKLLAYRYMEHDYEGPEDFLTHTKLKNLLFDGLYFRQSSAVTFLAEMYLSIDVKKAKEFFEVAVSLDHRTALDYLLEIAASEIEITDGEEIRSDCQQADYLVKRMILNLSRSYPVNGNMRGPYTGIIEEAGIISRVDCDIEKFIDAHLDSPELESLPGTLLLKKLRELRNAGEGTVREAIDLDEILKSEDLGTRCELLEFYSKKTYSEGSGPSVPPEQLRSERAAYFSVLLRTPGILSKCRHWIMIPIMMAQQEIVDRGARLQVFFDAVSNGKRDGDIWAKATALILEAREGHILTRKNKNNYFKAIESSSFQEYYTIFLLEEFRATESWENAARLLIGLARSGQNLKDRDFDEGGDFASMIAELERPIVREIQKNLRDVKLYKGAIDGIWGSGTRRALRQLRQLGSAESVPLD